jgi:hypothetical protein
MGNSALPMETSLVSRVQQGIQAFEALQEKYRVESEVYSREEADQAFEIEVPGVLFFSTENMHCGG